MLKERVTDLEQSLRINKQIISSLINGDAMTASIAKMREDNEKLYATLNKCYEERALANSQVLIL